MKISYTWLKDYVDIDVDPHLLAEKLSLTGFEVEEVIEQRLDFPRVVVGKVLSVEKHPDADKLSVCKVDVGTEVLNIVCGAPNVATNQKVPVALIGAELPGGWKIKRTKIRGVESEGMICSQKELAVSEEGEGIWVLDEHLKVGLPLDQALKYEPDFIFDIAITPNRPDGLGHIGIAREVAAIFGLPLNKPEPEFPEVGELTREWVTVEILSPQSCPRYAARIIRGIKVGPSPHWLVRRLEAVGMRSINNIVDVTNYVMMETGQPLHAFDYDLIEGKKIIVRESHENEKFTTLDGKEHSLPAGTVLICDAQKPVAIGGIMGGLNSEVSQNTRNILLESAYFTPENIQRGVRQLGISTEASQRFEKGTDPNNVLYAQARATELINKLAGGEVLKDPVDNYARKIFPVQIPLKTEQINTLLGTSLSAEQMASILQKIELKVENGVVTVPTFRPDLTRVADLAEEIARLYGFDNIPAATQTAIYYQYRKNQFDAFVDDLKYLLTGMGLQEIITNSMINVEKWERLTGEKIYPILNPISADMSGMRNNLILSSLNVIQWNVNRQMKNLRIFEINRVFFKPEKKNQLPREAFHLGIALTGKRQDELWYSDKQDVDFFDIKGLVEAIIAKIPLDKFEFIYYDNFAVEPGLQIKSGGEVIGYLGKVRHSILKEYDLENDVFVTELDVEKLYRQRVRQKAFQPIPRFPWVERDLAVVVDDRVPVGQLIESIQKSSSRLLKDVFIFDVYKGKQIEAGKKSVAFRLIFQSPERTLTEEEVNEQMEKILEGLISRHKAKLR